jgi:hypothetical protein
VIETPKLKYKEEEKKSRVYWLQTNNKNSLLIEFTEKKFDIMANKPPKLSLTNQNVVFRGSILESIF